MDNKAQQVKSPELTKQGALEAEQNLIGFFDLLYRIDKRNQQKLKSLEKSCEDKSSEN